jgi:cell division protein FtsB
MANVFGILTAIVLAISAFVAYKNKAAYQTEIDNTAARKTELNKNIARLKLVKDNIVDNTAKRTEEDAENLKLAEDEVAQKKINDELEAQKTEMTAKVATNKEKLDGIREKTSKLGQINELAGKMKKFKSELEGLSQSISSTEAKLANLSGQNLQAEKEIGGIKDILESLSKNQSLPSLNTRIRSIYPEWGFVTLAAGNSSGVVSNSTLNVVRDGTMIAKLMVTAVETSSASASIIPDSVAKDVTLMAGDRVVPGIKDKAATTSN